MAALAKGRTSAKTKLNLRTLKAMEQGYVVAFAKMGSQVINVADPPDAEPFGKGLLTTGSWGVWVHGKKVAGFAAKPRKQDVRDGITLMCGFAWPGRFQELGTVKQPPRPFLGPAMMMVIPGAEAFFKAAEQEALAGLP